MQGFCRVVTTHPTKSISLSLIAIFAEPSTENSLSLSISLSLCFHGGGKENENQLSKTAVFRQLVFFQLESRKN